MTYLEDIRRKLAVNDDVYVTTKDTAHAILELEDLLKELKDDQEDKQAATRKAKRR